VIVPRIAQDERIVAAHYDSLDTFYRSLWGEDIHHGLWITGRERPEEAVRRLTELVAASAGLRAGEAVCDLGCGYGGTARLLADVYACRVTGVTNSRAQYERAAAHSASRGPAPRYVLRPWEENGLASGSFDAVIAIESLSHVSDKAHAFAECARVLRPHGRLVISDWIAPEAPGSLQVRLLLEPICREGHLPSLGSAAEYSQMLARCGLRVERILDLTEKVRRTWTVALRRAAVRLLRDPTARRTVGERGETGRGDVLSLLRIPLAFRTGALRYGLVVAARR
jgi:tocopherol O-methyltransferase